jgi:hypothetical protein
MGNDPTGAGFNFAPIDIFPGETYAIYGSAFAASSTTWSVFTNASFPLTGSAVDFVAEQAVNFQSMIYINDAGTLYLETGTVSASPAAGATTLGQVGGRTNFNAASVFPVLAAILGIGFTCGDAIDFAGVLARLEVAA